MSIVLDGLTKRFAGQPVVDRLSLELTDGELFVLLGSSGSGKSTVLRLIAGLLSPDEGRILLHDRDVTALAPQKRGVGFVFQNYSIFRHMTAARNIEFGLRIRGVSAAERAERREELLDIVGLGGLGGRYPHQLSGGQLQRVALARALAYRPAVLLLDEPFGALDAKIRSQLRRSLRDIQKRLAVTTILVTHDQDEAFEVGDRIGVLDRGHLLEQGRAPELYDRPRSLFVATFLGAGTVFVGRAEHDIAGFGTFSLPIPADVPHENGARVQMLCRPEQVALAAERSDLDGPVIGRGTVLEESFVGPVRRIRLRIPRIPRLRQVAPPPVFGEEGLIVDAALASDQPVPAGEVWVGLKGWKILERPAPRILAAEGAEASATARTAAGELASALGGSTRVLGVAQDADDVERIGAELRSRTPEPGRRISVKVRSGRFAHEVLAEQAESVYDAIVLDGAPAGDGRGGARSRSALLRIVEGSSTPMIVVKGSWANPKSMLVCTAVGEPGKTVIRFAGWLARNLGASVTLFHARLADDEPEFVRAHLERGLAALRALDVPCRLATERAKSPAEGILRQASREEAGLIAIGSHGPSSRSVFGRDDVTLQILAASDRPVLVVPESAW